MLINLNQLLSLTGVISVVGFHCFVRSRLIETVLVLIRRSIFYKAPPNA